MSWTGALAWVATDAEIGSGTTIGTGATIGPNVKIGDNCQIGPGVRIGQSGFGYERREGRWEHKLESDGVVIEDDVHIGANTCIDRGSYRPTYICTGVRIDNLVHVAHNAIVGAHSLVVAHAGLGGSCVVGEGCWIGFGALIKEHVEIGRRALIGMGAVVLKDVPAHQTWAGNPARCISAVVGVRERM